MRRSIAVGIVLLLSFAARAGTLAVPEDPLPSTGPVPSLAVTPTPGTNLSIAVRQALIPFAEVRPETRLSVGLGYGGRGGANGELTHLIQFDVEAEYQLPVVQRISVGLGIAGDATRLSFWLPTQSFGRISQFNPFVRFGAIDTGRHILSVGFKLGLGGQFRHQNGYHLDHCAPFAHLMWAYRGKVGDVVTSLALGGAIGVRPSITSSFLFHLQVQPSFRFHETSHLGAFLRQDVSWLGNYTDWMLDTGVFYAWTGRHLRLALEITIPVSLREWRAVAAFYVRAGWVF